MKAFLLAAGLGTRLKPFTDKHPKALAEVNGQTLLERNIRNLQRQGIDEVVVNVHHFAEQIMAILEKHQGFGSQFHISDERLTVLETGGGLKNAAPLLRGVEPILMMNVDVLCEFNLKQMQQQHTETNALATLAVQKRTSSRKLLFDSKNQLCGWKNVKTGEERRPGTITSENHLQEFAFSGIQLLAPPFLDKIQRNGKFSIIDVYLDLCVQEKIMAWNHTGDFWLDVGKPDSLKKAQQQVKP